MPIDQKAFERALENCAAEPIHQIGHIQPHGALLALTLESPQRVVQASRNIGDFLATDPTNLPGRTLAEIFPPEEAAVVATLLASLDELPTATGRLARDELLLHAFRSGDRVVLEMERDRGQHEEGHLAELLLQTQQVMLQTDAYFDTARYFSLLTDLVRQLTGFDSVMVYRFDSDWNGEIIAQSRDPRAPSYQGMHFPASDIPAQARLLYTTNLVRIVADVDAVPVPIVPELDPHSGKPLDLSHSALRSLSPIHIEYLRNIGVGASLVISLLQNGRLWGLIACHHLAPRAVSLGLREAGIFLSRLVSTRLSSLEAIEKMQLADRANQITSDLLRTMPTTPVRELVLGLLPELQKLLGASGILLIVEGELHAAGALPDADGIARLLTWLGERPQPTIFASNHLAALDPVFAGDAANAAGLLATPPTPGMRNGIVWLRPEKARTISWAGKYEEGFVQNAAGDYRLTPRKSFALWTEAWRGRSIPWTDAELGIATLLALAIPEGLAQRHQLELVEAALRRHRDELEATVRERTLALSVAKEAADSANRAKVNFLSKISHELRTPMNGIMGMIALSRRKASEPKLLDYLGKMQESADRLLAIINRMIDIAEIEAERMTLDQDEFALGDLLDEVYRQSAGKAAAKQLAFSLDVASDVRRWIVLGDRGRLGQVWHDLVDNAIKFTAQGFVGLACEVVPAPDNGLTVICSVRDSGIGISREVRPRLFETFEQGDNSPSRRFGGTGLGLALCRRLARMMHGDIEVDSQDGSGSIFRCSVRLLPVRQQS